MKFFFFVILSLTLVSSALAKATSPGLYYVTASQLSVRLGPNKMASITNTLYKKQRVNVLEVQDGWARISKYYTGSVEGKTGKVARWVFAEYLAEKLPAEKGHKNTVPSPVANAIKSSDNYSMYSESFIKVSESLIKQGKCTLGDFKEMGGWMRSSSHKPKPIFFTYCGGMSKKNRIYFNAQTGKVFK